VKSTHFNVLNTGKYRQIFAGIGIWSPEYRYSGIGIYRIGNTNLESLCTKVCPAVLSFLFPRPLLNFLDCYFDTSCFY
jgi:hypothetical protein